MCKNWFTGKRKDNGEWVEGFLFDDGLADSKRMFVGNLVIVDYTGIADNKFDIVGTYFYEVIPETVGQCTGLTDKNGKKIFEGDIVRIDGKNYEVQYLLGQFFVGINMPIAYKRFDCEIIGNITDNPELIKEAKEDGNIKQESVGSCKGVVDFCNEQRGCQ